MVREIMNWLFWVVLQRALLMLPRQTAFQLAAAAGKFCWPLKREYHKALTAEKPPAFIEYVSSCFTLEEVVEKGIINHFKKECEVFFFPEMGKEDLKKWIAIEGKEHLDNALKKQKGVLLLHLHFGAIHIPILALGNLGYSITQVGVNPLFLSEDSKRNMSYFTRNVWETKLFYEKLLPADFIYIGTSMKKIFSCLKNNGIIDMAADGRKGSQDITTRFIGQNISFSLGPFRIAKKTGAVILPTFVIRNSDNTHKLIIEAPINPEELDVEKMLDSFLKIAEEYVYKYPCHYIRMLKTLCTDKNIS